MGLDVDVTIATGVHTEYPMSFALDRFGRIHGQNGMERGIYWDGFTAATDASGIDGPGAAPTLASPATGALTAGDYVCYYRFVDNRDGHKVFSSLSASASVTVVLNDAIDWSVLSTSSQSRVNFVELWRTTVGGTDILYKIATLGHNGTITSSANSGGNIEFTVPEGHNVVADQSITVSGSSEATDNATHRVTSVTATTILTTTSYTGDGTGGTWVCEGFYDDDDADTVLQAFNRKGDDFMRLTTPDGALNANRHVPPPNFMGVITRYQDRMLYAVPRSYGTGTVATTAGSTTITGTGTSWTSEMVGRTLQISGEVEHFIIATFSSTTSITVDRDPANTASGLSYVIKPDATNRNKIMYSEQDEPESVPATNTITIQENVDDQDEMTGMLPYGSQLLALKERHIYRVWFYSQPRIDAGVALFAYRGCVNSRCWGYHEGIIYLMDELGAYAITGGQVQPIGYPIQDKFRPDGPIDWSNKKWFHVQVDPHEELVYFFVTFTADSGTYPERAYVWDIRNKRWYEDRYWVPIGHSTQAIVSNQARAMVSGHDGLCWLLGDGTVEGLNTGDEASGTATASTSTTLTDSGASFVANDHENSTIAIVKGTGAGQIRRIDTVNSGTQVTVDSAWTTNPSTDSEYQVGPIEYFYKTGMFALAGLDEYSPFTFRLNAKPTTDNVYVNLRRYIDHSATAKAEPITRDQEDGLSTTQDDSDVVINMKSARSEFYTEPGTWEWRWGGHREGERGKASRWTSAEIQGYQYDEQLEFHELEIQGVL
jgi:hypothetical protein